MDLVLFIFFVVLFFFPNFFFASLFSPPYWKTVSSILSTSSPTRFSQFCHVCGFASCLIYADFGWHGMKEKATWDFLNSGLS